MISLLPLNLAFEVTRHILIKAMLLLCFNSGKLSNDFIQACTATIKVPEWYNNNNISNAVMFDFLPV